jgi:hypothetical protein
VLELPSTSHLEGRLGTDLRYMRQSLLQDELDCRPEVVEVERLSKYQKAVKLEFRAKGCNKNDFRSMRQLPQPTRELIAIESGHHQITDHQVDTYAWLLYHCQCFLAVCCSQDLTSQLLQLSGNDVANGIVIIYYQYGWGMIGGKGNHLCLLFVGGGNAQSAS